MINDKASTNPGFNHNTAWQSDAVARNYDARRFRSIGGRWYDNAEKRAITSCLDTVERRAPIQAVLDLACGTGRISAVLAVRGYQLTCGDISSEMMAMAKQRLEAQGADGARFIKADIYATGQPDGAFDLVTAFRLFQHLTSDERTRALAEMARISRRFVLVNVMYTSGYYGAVRTVRRALGRYTTRYTSSAREIERELAIAKLRLVKSVFTQPGFNGDRVLLLEKAG